MNDREPRPVHQLLLGLRHGEGVSVLAHSMASEGQASSWQNRLEKHVRLLPWETETTLPPNALSYYQFSGYAAVLRRWAAGGSLGRSNAHALIGPIDVLTVPVALGLDSGLDWRGVADNARSSLDSRELTSLARDTVAQLRSRAIHEPEMLRRALGKLIDAQVTPLTILGCPDSHRVALTWALIHIGNEYLAKTSHLSRSWTFSTYEIDDADSIADLPEILFMPGKPAGRRIASREIVDVSRDEPVSPQAGAWSKRLVQRFISGAPLLSESDHLSAMPSVAEVSISTGQPERRGQEHPPEQSVPDHQQCQASASTYPKEWSQVPAARTAGSRRLEKDIDDLPHAESINLLDARLAMLGRTPEQRAEIREILSVEDYLKIIFVIMKWDPSTEDMLALFQRLRVATFGSGGRDLSDPEVVEFAVQLVAHPNTPDVFVHDLVQDIDANGPSNRVDPILAVRWREQHSQARELAGASTGRHRRPRTVKAGPLGAMMSVPATPRWPLAVAGVATLAFILFVAMYSIDTGTPPVAEPSGRGNQASQTTTSVPSGARQGNESAQPAGGFGGAGFGGAKPHDLAIQRSGHIAEDKTAVFLLLWTANENHFYPQEECDVDSSKRTWTCGKIPLRVPATIKSPIEVLVVKINPQDKKRYQTTMKENRPLEDPLPKPEDVLLRESESP